MKINKLPIRLHKISKCVKDLCEDVLRLHLQRISLNDFGLENIIYNE